MDIGEIKTEPPIVVKEEIPDDAALSEEADLQTCCYCGARKQLCALVQVPDAEKELSKWSRILGKAFYKNYPNGKMVCRNHFDDEFGDSQLIDIVFTDKVVGARLDRKVKCCYCEKKRMARSLTTVTCDSWIFEHWVKILGNKFYENFQKSKSNFICRSHFNIQWYGRRPRDLLPMANLDTNLNKTKKLEMELNHSTDETPEKNLGMSLNMNMRLELKHKCDYCGELKLSFNLTSVPRSPTILKQWADILGEDFYKNVSGKQNSFICRSHFDVEWEKIRPRGLLPCTKTVRMLTNEVKNEVFIDSHSEVDSLSPPIVYTDQIKVEPLVIVKEELENYEDESFELKLETEDKPETIEEFECEQNKSSKFQSMREETRGADKNLIFVKEKLEIDRLEDEEKPLIIEEFRLEEEKPSTSDNVEKNGIEFNEKPHHLLDVEIQHPMNFNIQEEPSDQKRIKLEVKEEEE